MKLEQKNILKKKFIKGDLINIKTGYYFIYQEWLHEKSLSPNQKPVLVDNKTVCKFVKNSPEGPSYKIIELPSGEQVEVLTVHILNA